MPKDNRKVFRKPSTETVDKNTNSNGIMKAPEQTVEPFIVNRISLTGVDRTPKNVGDWRNSHQAAESIYYPNRSRILDLYKDVELDGHLTGIVGKRIKTVLNKKIRFVKDNVDVVNVTKLIESIEFRQQNKEILLHTFWGLTGFEYIPGDKFKFKLIPRKHIKPEKQVLTVNQSDYEGTPYEDIDNIWIINDDPRELGLYLKCAFYYLLKKGDFSDWANYIEIFGQPLIITKYDAYDVKTREQLTKAIENIGSVMRLAIPKQADFDVVDGKTANGNGDLQKQFKDACNDELSVMVLGNTETTKSSSSSGFAQSKTHGKQQNEVIKDDVNNLLALLNSEKYINILRSYGYDVDGGKFVVEEMMEVADQKIRAEVYDLLKNKLGLPLDDDDIYEEFGVNKPKNYEEQKAKQDLANETVEDVFDETPEGEKPKPPAPTKKPAKPKPAANKANLSAWHNLRAKLADFFDPAHKG